MDFKKTDVVKRFQHKDKTNILIYVDSLYWEKSELNHITDLTLRKKAAIEKSSITDPDLIDQLVNLTDDSINEVIFHYLSSQNSNRFIQLCADQQLLWEMQQEILKPIEGEEKDDRLKAVEYKDKVSIRSNELLKRINVMYSDIYKNDQEIELAVRTIHDMATYEQRLKKYRNVQGDKQPVSV